MREAALVRGNRLARQPSRDCAVYPTMMMVCVWRLMVHLLAVGQNELQPVCTFCARVVYTRGYFHNEALPFVSSWGILYRAMHSVE